MKAKHFIITCIIIVLGALYGRFLFKKDGGFLREDANFFTFLCMNADKKESPKQQDKEKPGENKIKKPGITKTGDLKKNGEKPGKKVKKSQPPPPRKKRNTDPSVSLKLAREALIEGRYDNCIQMISQVPGPESQRISFYANLLRQMIKDVPVDPGAHSKQILKVDLENGNPLYAVEANNIGNDWHLILVNGIKCSGMNIKSVKKIDPATFRIQRMEELKKQIKGISNGGSFNIWKSIRLAWRRGFPDIAYNQFKKLAKTDKALKALAMVLPEKGQGIIALATNLPGKAKSIENSIPSKAEPKVNINDTVNSPGIKPAPRPQAVKNVIVNPGVVSGDSASVFAVIDTNIRKAQKKIYQALNMKGKGDKLVLKEAGDLLLTSRKMLLNDRTLPHNKDYQQRLQRITIILEDFLKMSGFGL